MVRLKEIASPPLKAEKHYFNSSMVRLKEVDRKGNVQNSIFQFLNGAIKRRQPTFTVNPSSISIPQWCD